VTNTYLLFDNNLKTFIQSLSLKDRFFPSTRDFVSAHLFPGNFRYAIRLVSAVRVDFFKNRHSDRFKRGSICFLIRNIGNQLPYILIIIKINGTDNSDLLKR